MRSALAPLGAGLIVLVTACTPDAAPSGPRVPANVADGTIVTNPTTGPWAEIVEGETGPGSKYALYIPRNFNGDAVYYAHGIRFPGTPVDLRDQDQFFAARDILGGLGFAFAYSSFSDNGFVIKDGAQRTHQLRGLLATRLGGQPTRSFLMAHSLGAGIGLKMVEDYAGQYNGALLMCGIVGGSMLQTQYIGQVRALFDAFFPGRLPGNVVSVPPGTVVTLPQIIAAVQSNPAGLYAIASMLQTPLPFVPLGSVTDPTSTAFQTLVGSLFAPLSFQALLANNVTDLAHGSAFENRETVYQLGAAPLVPGLGPLVALANATVKRYAMPPQTENYLEKYFTPTGNLQMPVLTLHNTWDPGVPLFHEGALAAMVAAAGATGNLLQRQVQSYGHCAIPASTAVQNFLDMVTWATTGAKPAA
jgi:hypothetical protein